MFKKISHAAGVQSEVEILFSTAFNYMFPDAARSRPCLLPQTETTQNGLRALGQAMADNGTPGNPMSSLDSQIPAVFTYLGQFIDHDITARTDRDSTITMLGKGEPIDPLDPDKIVSTLRNGRRPQLDLDSVFGEWPGLAGSTTTESQILYDSNYKFIVFEGSGRVDLPRQKATDIEGVVTFPATIADMRNDENINISQLHTAFLKFYNAVHADQPGTDKEKHIRARQLVRWAYQYIVVNEYLPTVCDKNVVLDTFANGPRFLGSTAGRADAFMPLEFSVAAFRFGHSMIRPFYKLSATSGDIKLIKDPMDPPGTNFLLGTNGNPDNFEADNQLKNKLVIEWKNFVGATAQKARKIDTKIAHDLFTLPFRPDDPVLTSLAQSNLFRGFNLSIPMGQAVCDAMSVNPLTPAEILTGEDPAIAAAIKNAYFHHRTPLWYYVLREAAVHEQGEHLGEVGSRILAETLIGLLKQDPNSYLNNKNDAAVKTNGIDVKPGPGGLIGSLVDLLKKAGFTGI